MHRHPVFQTILLIAAALCGAAADAQSSSNSTGDNRDNPETLAASTLKIPVRFRDHALFDITQPIGELSPAERAAAIERRLLALAAGPPDVLQDFRMTERDGQTEIYAGETLIRTLTDADAAGTGRTRRQLAADQTELVRAALAVEFRDRSTTSLLRAAGFAVLASVLFVAALFGLRGVHRWIRGRTNRFAKAWRRESRVGRLLPPATVATVSRALATTLAWLVGLTLLYFYLEYVLSLIPWTRGIAANMFETAESAIVRALTGMVDYLPRLLNLLILGVIAHFVLKAIRALFLQIKTGRIVVHGFYSEWALPTYSLIRFLVIAIAAVMMFPYLPGSGSEGFKGISVFIGLLVSLGAASAIANLIAGVVITYMRPFQVGDRVKIADAVGDVTGKDLFVVRVRTIKNVDITIPNSLVLANHIVNFSSSADSHGLILHTTVTIGYSVPWQQVQDLLIAAAGRTEGVLAEPAPYVLQTSLNDFHVSYELNVFTKQPREMSSIYSRLHSEIQKSFAEAGVEIMSPSYAAVRDGNRAAIPEENLPKNYQAPGFNILSRILRPGT